jgi:hypothetical protein
MARNRAGEPRVPRRVVNPSFGALIAGYLVLNAVAAAIDTLIWGWTGLIATGVGGLLLLGVFVLIVRRGRMRRRAR